MLQFELQPCWGIVCVCVHFCSSAHACYCSQRLRGQKQTCPADVDRHPADTDEVADEDAEPAKLMAITAGTRLTVYLC